MRPNRALLTLSSLCWCLLLGCGASSSPAPALPSPGNLTGDWLLAGTLPDAASIPAQPPFGLTGTFRNNSTTVTGVVTAQLVCNQTSLFLTGPNTTIVTGTVATDGSFTLQPPTIGLPTPSLTATISGHVPSTAGGNWTGTYVLTSSMTGCSPATGSIAAALIPPLTGTFKGLLTASSLNSQSLTVTASLTEGGTVTNGSTTTYIPSELSGTLALANPACPTTGTTNTNTSVEGNSVAATFQMSDGSVYLLSGSVVSADGSQIDVNLFQYVAGSCGSNSIRYTGRLVRQ